MTQEATTPPPATPSDRTWLERALSPIAEIRRGEATGALLMSLLMFLVLAAYYELKTAREIFILSEGGAAVKSYSSAGQALLLLFVVPAYGAFASRVDRLRLVRGVTSFFIGNLVLFALALQFGFHIGIPFFLWLGIFNLMVIAQFWAFASDIYTQEQGKRIFPLIGVGSSLGAWVGSVRAGQLVENSGPMRLLVGGGLLLVVCVFLVTVINRQAARSRVAGPDKAAPSEADEPIGGDGGFTLIRKDRYLMLIAGLMVVLNIVNTSGEYLFGRYVVEQANAQFTDAAARQRFIGETYSYLFSTVNLLGFLLQMFVVSRVFKFLGVGRALFIHPFVALTGYLLMMRTPSVQLMTTLKIADNSLDYSLGNTTKQALWLPNQPRSEVQGQAGRGLLLRPHGRRDPGRRRVRGGAPRDDRSGVRLGQRRAVGGLDWRRGAAQRRTAPQGRPRGTALTGSTNTVSRHLAPVVLLAAGLALCGGSPASAQSPRLVQPGAPGQPTREISASEATDTSAVRHRPADTRFMQGMIGHHAQALEMVALVERRSRNDDLKRLALRIDVSQRDEMAMMREWLTRREEALPDPHAHHQAHGQMPGMLTPDQMAKLAAAEGQEFDRLFLEGMIQHHEGALTMVKDLFATPGGGQEPEMFDFAADVEADQAMEIARMRALLREIGK